MSHFGAGIFDDDPPPPPPPRKPAKHPAQNARDDAGPPPPQNAPPPNAQQRAPQQRDTAQRDATQREAHRDATPPQRAPLQAEPLHRERPVPVLDEPPLERPHVERPHRERSPAHEPSRQPRHDARHGERPGERHGERHGDRGEPRREARELHYGHRDEPAEPPVARDAYAEERGSRQQPQGREEPPPRRERDERRDWPREERRPRGAEHARHRSERDDRGFDSDRERSDRPRHERAEHDRAPQPRQHEPRHEPRPRSTPPARRAEQIAVLVNLAELEAEARRNGGELAYRKVLRAVATGRDVVRAVCALPRGTSAGAQAALRAAGFDLLPTSVADAADTLATAAAGLPAHIDAIVLAPWSGTVARSLPRGAERIEAAGFDAKAPPGVQALPLGRDCLFIP